LSVVTAWLHAVLLHYFNPDGFDEWDLRGRPPIRAGMPVLIGEDLRFEDEHGQRPATVINRRLRELPVSGAPSPRTWRTYAQVLKTWVEFLDARGFRVFGDRQQLRDALSAYAEHRVSGGGAAGFGELERVVSILHRHSLRRTPQWCSFPPANGARSHLQRHRLLRRLSISRAVQQIARRAPSE